MHALGRKSRLMPNYQALQLLSPGFCSLECVCVWVSPACPRVGVAPEPLRAQGLMHTWILSCTRGQAVPGRLHQESCAPASGRGCPVDPHPSWAPTPGPASRPCTPGGALGELHGESELWPVASEPSQKASSDGGQGETTHWGYIQPCLWKAKAGSQQGAEAQQH